MSTQMHYRLPNLNRMKPARLCRQSSFVVRQNSWADVVAVVITPGLKGSRWLSSYKPRVKAEGKHRHQNNTKLSHCNAVTQRSRVCWGKSKLSQCGVIKPSRRERGRKRKTEQEKTNGGKTKQHRVVGGITDNTCCFYTLSQLFWTTLQKQFYTSDDPLNTKRIWITIRERNDQKLQAW